MIAKENPPIILTGFKVLESTTTAPPPKVRQERTGTLFGAAVVALNLGIRLIDCQSSALAA
jgi:hypothetical protein